MSTLGFVVANIRWLAAGLLLTLFSSFGQTFFISLVAGDLRETFSLSHGDFGGIYMMATLFSAATLAIFGRIVDDHSIAVISTGVILGLTLFCIGMANVSSVWMLFFVIYGLRLFGQGMMTHAAMTAMGRWYSAERGRAVSIATLGHQLGEATLPLIFVAMFAVVGWRGGWWIAAGALVLVGLPLLLWLLQIERTPRAKKVSGAPEVGRQWTRGEVLRDPAFWIMSCGTLAPAFIGTTIFFHQVYLVELRGWTMELFASAFTAMAIMTIVFALITGWLVDRFTAVRILPAFLLPLAAACLALAGITHPVAAFIFMMLLGVTYGISSTLVGSLWPEVYGTRHLGAIRSIVVAMMVLASALGPGVTGWLIDIGVPYGTQMVAMAVYCVSVAILMGVISVRVTRRMSAAT
ncbi:MFS transporter [Rhizobiales bacterium]|uniref:MFS transporter n=1 Tax=Hongsoonwoonella zoysiae TaxID=2821844 RepID=UPI0015604162|nr:MFS transporter [Hongsoonwoonella zoysiae]NRG18614.1 MFS transporter [Hongsoonwoonella zoysiae]